MNPGTTAQVWARQRIQAAGLRATPARVATLALLRDFSAPLTHAEVSARLTEHEVDKATVYRNLNDMAAAKLLRRSELGDHVWRFEIIAEEERAHASHPHFVCIDCGSVSCLQEIELTEKSKSVSERFGQVTEILLRGHCRDCV
ncbi:MAG: transcriptional repressor [Planctomycetota bacterium]|nr:MAG: transcriptional repressor [Planctomycetota bacterium]